ncbi:MAG: transketolase, partial [Bdellovibrionales bacterium]|nr:transketolase [Bdellovibrionales bacterium]
SPTATRGLVALMDMEAVIGGAASHFGGPSGFAEMMSAIFGYMFWQSQKQKKEWHQLFHFVNDAGHCENGLYALKANYKLAGLDIEHLRHFRSIESVLTGHGEAHLFPQSVYISNGPLGSGLPQAQGLAAAESLSASPRTTVVAISDGGCMEGEAREAFAAIPGLAANKKLGPVLCMISDNNTKLSGRIDKDSFSMTPTFASLAAQGWNVITVGDGHDLQGVFTAIEQAMDALKKDPTTPVALWCKTIKGKGVKKTEESSSGGHGFPLKKYDELPAFLTEIFSAQEMPQQLKMWLEDLVARESKKTTTSASSVKKEKAQDGVSKALIEAVEKHQLPVISISADLQGSTGVENFRKKFPAHTFEVGVAESNMVSMGIGLSKQGYLPVVDTFAQFGVTKGALPLIMSGLSEGPVMGIFSHTGFQDAADGASHQALAYLAMSGSIPHVETYCLTCSEEAYHLVSQALQQMAEDKKRGVAGKSYLFFLGRETFPPKFNETATYKLGKAHVISDRLGNAAQKVMIAVSGSLVSEALEAQEKLAQKNIGSIVVNPAVMNRPDVEFFAKWLPKADGNLVTLEDHRVIGGMASVLVPELLSHDIKINRLRTLGVGDEFGRSSYTAKDLYKLHGLDAEAVVKAVTH